MYWVDDSPLIYIEMMIRIAIANVYYVNMFVLEFVIVCIAIKFIVLQSHLYIAFMYSYGCIADMCCAIAIMYWK